MDFVKAKLYGTLDGQSYKKIFPQQYFDKFAPHLKILQFQKQIFQKPPQSGKLHFTQRSSKKSQNKNISQKTQPKIKLNKFAKISDTLQFDKAQLVRFKIINRKIDDNLNYSPSNINRLKDNQIKTLKSNQQINEHIIDNMMIESTRETNEKIKEKLQLLKNRTVLGKFIKRDLQKQGRNSYKSKLQWTDMKRYNSQRKMSISKANPQEVFSKRMNRYSGDIKGDIKNKLNSKSTKNTSSSNVFLKVPIQGQFLMKDSPKQTRNRINSMNKITNKSSQRIRKKSISTTKIRVDLIGETQKIKQGKYNIQPLIYSTEVINQPWKTTLQSLLKSTTLRTNQNDTSES